MRRESAASLGLAMLGMLIAQAADAAMLSTIKGQILVDTGKGYAAVGAAADLPIGAKIMVPPGGLARIMYPDGCVRQMKPGSITFVAQQSPCLVAAQLPSPIVTGQLATDNTENAQNTESNGSQNQPETHADGGTQGATQPTTPSIPAGAPAGFTFSPVYVIGAVAVAGGGYFIKTSIDQASNQKVKHSP